jgi:hypothetical protein
MTGPRIALLDFLSVADIRGDDAAGFLHAQLCGDVLAMAPGQCRFTAWCTPQGRVVAAFVLARSASGFRMILCRDIAARFLEKLRKYVLRSRVELVDRGAEIRIAGWHGAPAAPPVPDHGRVWAYAELEGLATAALPGSQGNRLLFCGAPSALAALKATPEQLPGWILEDVAAGIPWIGASLSEKFLPQELDLESLGGLSYTKGCFPGQEIIQRVHSRGRLKRALRRFSAAAAPPPPAARILGADGTPHGLVVAASDSGDGNSAGLAVVDTEAALHEPLHLETSDAFLLRFDATRDR